MRGVLKPREERIANDAYYTPDSLADAICERLDAIVTVPRSVWDPCCGGLAFVNAALETWSNCPSVLGTDLPDNDFLSGLPAASGIDLIVTNPPFLLAERFFARAIDLVADGGHVAFLLRLSFLGGQGRSRTIYAQRNLRWLMPITPRPSFTPDGKTDAAEYALFVWQRGYHGDATLTAPLVWKRSAEGAA